MPLLEEMKGMNKMGAHKYNPNVKLAKEGKLPPRAEKVSIRTLEYYLRFKIAAMINPFNGRLERYYD